MHIARGGFGWAIARHAGELQHLSGRRDSLRHLDSFHHLGLLQATPRPLDLATGDAQLVRQLLGADRATRLARSQSPHAGKGDRDVEVVESLLLPQSRPAPDLVARQPEERDAALGSSRILGLTRGRIRVTLIHDFMFSTPRKLVVTHPPNAG
jgi:hypothetical protein